MLICCPKMARLFTNSIIQLLSDEDCMDSFSSPREVHGSPHLKWEFLAVPQMEKEECVAIKTYIRVVGGPATVTGTVVAVDSYAQRDERWYRPKIRRFKFHLENGKKHGFKRDIRGLGPRFDYTITCNATFLPGGTKTVDPTTIHEFIGLDSGFFDATIKVEEREIKVNRGFLSMISPVFGAMFHHNTEESKTGIINITDFTHKTVKNVLDYCYGVNTTHNTPATVIDMIRFCDKYIIKPPMEKLHTWLKRNCTVKNFAAIADYAWQNGDESLQGKCGQVFNQNLEKLCGHPDFIQLGATVVAAIFKAGAAASTTRFQPSHSADEDDDE
uniref:BTB domain-containing protein n=1 Tax=Panagrellus redivivus TaxID=6233 RepID=A0A7E4W9L8_PANRE